MRGIAGGRALAAILVALLAGACTADRDDGTPGSGLTLSPVGRLDSAGGRNPTTAIDPRTGAIYVAWAHEVATPADSASSSERADPVIQVMAARSDDSGATFGPPTQVTGPDDRVSSSTVSPPQLAVVPNGDVMILYEHRVPPPATWYKGGGWYGGRSLLRLARSTDRAATFATPVEIGGEAMEGEPTTIDMLNIFAAPDGDVFVSWLDFRERMAFLIANQKAPPPNQRPATQLRMTRSGDGGRSFARSVLVAKPTCECCGTKMAQGKTGPLYATTRGSSREQKGSVDAVRDHFVATSVDDGATWSGPVKVHDDRFKVSACPDVTPGLAVDSKGRLHAAWYTGTERSPGPGILYARSDDQGKTFSPPATLLTGDWVPYSDVKLAIDSTDHVWVAFEDRRGDHDLIQVARIAPDGKIQFSTTWPGSSPDVAARGNAAIVTWGTPAADGHGGGAVEWLMVRPAGRR